MSQNYLEVNNWKRNLECPKCVYELKQLAIRDTSGRVSLKLCASEFQELMMTMMLKANKIQKYWENNVTISQRKSIQNSSSTSTCNKTSISKASIMFVNWEAFHCLDARCLDSRWSVFKSEGSVYRCHCEHWSTTVAEKSMNNYKKKSWHSETEIISNKQSENINETHKKLIKRLVY